MAEEPSPESLLPSPEVRGIQKLLYEHLMEETLTIELLQEFEQYLDTDIKILVCGSCSGVLEDFEECVYMGELSGSSLEEHLNLIEAGYCSCGDTETDSKTKTVGFRLIHKMARKDGNLPFLTFLHEHNCDLNARTLRLKDTAIVIAIRLKQIETVKYLVQNGAEINKGEGPINRIAPIVFAVQTKSEDIFRALLAAKNINVNICDSNGQPVLINCISWFPEGVRMLLEAGADPNVTDRLGQTPLVAAAQKKETELVKLLILHGADVNKEDRIRPVPLLQSVRQGDVATAAVLLEAGADPNYCNRGENKSLIVLASYNGSNEMINLLIKYGGDINLVSNREYSALHVAAWNGQSETVTLLLEAGAESDKQTADKNTPLALAAHGGHLDVIKLLLPLGCDVNNADRDGDTPLFYAVNNGMAEGVKLLLENGADPDICDNANASALWTAVYQKHKEVVKQLLVANVKMEVPSRGMDRHRWTDQIVHFYDNPKSPLYVAVERQRLDIAVLLITAGYNVHNEKWLFERDITESEERAKILDSLMKYIEVPLSLLAVCRNYLRRYFGHDLHQSVDELCIPASLKNYLTLKSLCETVEK